MQSSATLNATRERHDESNSEYVAVHLKSSGFKVFVVEVRSPDDLIALAEVIRDKRIVCMSNFLIIISYSGNDCKGSKNTKTGRHGASTSWANRSGDTRVHEYLSYLTMLARVIVLHVNDGYKFCQDGPGL